MKIDETKLGDRPIDPALEGTMNGLAKGLDIILNGDREGADKRTGFILMLFPLNDHGGRCNYISNGKRSDVVVMLKEQLKRFEGQPEISGHA